MEGANYAYMGEPQRERSEHPIYHILRNCACARCKAAFL